MARRLSAPGAAGTDDADRPATARRLLEQTRGEAIDRLARLAAQLTGAPSAHVCLLTDEVVVVGRHGGAAAGAASPVTERVVAAGEPVAAGATLGVPVRAAGELVGALCATDAAARTWSAHDTTALEAVAEAVATELELGGLAAEAAETAVRLDLGFAAANIGSFDWNLLTNELRWDDRLIEIFGYDPATFVPHIDTFFARVHPDDHVRVRGDIGRAVETCGDFGSEYRIVLPDGTARWIGARGRVLCGTEGGAERLIGAAYDTTGAHDSAEQVARLLETMSAAFCSVDRSWRFTYVNGEAERLLGHSRAELLGRVLWEAFPAAHGTAFEEHYRRAMETGEPETFEAHYGPLEGWYEVRAWPSADGLSVFFSDISDRIAAQEGRRRAVERLELLSEAGSRMTTLDVGELLATLDELLVPRFGAWLAVALHEDVLALVEEREGGGTATLRVAHVTAGAEEPVPQLLGLDAGTAVGDDAGRTVAEHVQRALRTAGAIDAAGALLTVPLVAHGRTLGVLVVGRPAEEHADRRLLDDIAARAGAALDNAVLYGAERRAGTALQHLLLPSELPQLPGIATAARYLAGTAGRLVGGDFYVGHQLDDGRLLLVIGDVMGHGMEAAARMGELRAFLTAYAFDGRPPEQILDRVAGRADHLLNVQMATVLVLVYDPRTRTLTASSAGHLPPLLAPIDAPPHYLDVPPGPPIGVGPATYPSITVDVPPASTIVLYTDGLVERRGTGLEEGLERLRDALTDVQLPPEQVCDHVLARLGREGGAPDDVALLVLSHL